MYKFFFGLILTVAFTFPLGGFADERPVETAECRLLSIIEGGSIQGYVVRFGSSDFYRKYLPDQIAARAGAERGQAVDKIFREAISKLTALRQAGLCQ